MDRNEFLNRCKAESLNFNSTTVELMGIRYRPKAYILGFDKKGKPIHTAMIQDLKSNAVMYANLEAIKE